MKLSGRVRLDILAESFNVTNRTNKRVQISDDGFFNSAGQFVAYSTSSEGKYYPGQYQVNKTLSDPNQLLCAPADAVLPKG